MSTIAIRAESLSKTYKIGAEQGQYRTFREVFSETFLSPFRSARDQARRRSKDSTFYALRDVGFEILRGEVTGVIGRNGAGKSTLLKILSRITEPTSGFVEISGRVGSLLEVGTGFHPELTGRENIILNGAILGMKRSEIMDKFEEIVSFSEIEKFIDTPVKFYSSGMYVRLAFGVAAHMESEILLVDEVLSVGDIAFQRKCLGKMDDLAKAGRTVIIVSHNMASIARLCRRGLLLEKGMLVFAGTIEETISRYQASAIPALEINLKDVAHRSGSGIIRIRQVQITNEQGNASLSSGCTMKISMELESEKTFRSSSLRIGIGINGPSSERLVTLMNRFDPKEAGRDTMIGDGTRVECRIRDLPLSPGNYYLSLYIDVNDDIADSCKDAMQIVVTSGDYYGTGLVPAVTQGPIMIRQEWSYPNAMAVS